MFEILRNALMKETGEAGRAGRKKLDRMINNPEIIAGVSHEIRTQMNSIMAFSHLIGNERFTDAERREFSDHIIRSCEQLIGLFENYFDTAILKTVNGGGEKLRETDITSLFESLTSDFRVYMGKKGHDSVVLIHEDNLPEKLILKLDPARLTRIVSNLFRNALNHTFSGFIKVGCTYGDEIITMYVKDSGQGYSKSRDLLLSDNPEIRQSDSQDTYSAMNLILARNLISTMEGTIRVESDDGKATSVFVSLPVKECSGYKILSGTSSEDRVAI